MTRHYALLIVLGLAHGISDGPAGLLLGSLNHALAFGGEHLVLLLAGVALLQSATSAVLVLMARALPRQPATAAGMALGLAIAAGGLPLMSGLSDWISTPAVLLAAVLLAAALLWWTAQGRCYVMRIDTLGDN
ncbi:MAG: hypothetical protein M1546_12110 [Chloroflexi bacterium]|nr:hypothetical protein [Chloroflexota bacterium]